MSKGKRKTARIYYNEPGMPPLWWKVKVSDAKKNVIINGTFEDAILGYKGSTVGCHLSNCAERNKSAFPHPVLLVSVTRSVCLVVDKITNGQPSHAYKYYHKYANYVDLNDEDVNKEVISTWPELANRPFTLMKPWKSTTSGKSAPRGNYDGTRRSQLVKGALRRAITAGLISKPVAKILEKQPKK